MADINARMRQLIGTTSSWSLNDLIIGDGEIAAERRTDGSIKFKVGDGVRRFSQLPYLFAGTGEDGLPGPPGPPGGNVMSVGLFTSVGGLTIPVGTDIIQTSGHTVQGRGADRYVYDPAVDAAFVSANPRWSVVTANGRGFRYDFSTGMRVNSFGADPVTKRTDPNAAAAAATNFSVWNALIDAGLYFKVNVIVGNVGSSAPGWQFLYAGTPEIHFDIGYYYFGGNTLHVAQAQWRFIGKGAGNAGGGGAATILQWDGSCDGMVWHEFMEPPPIPGNRGWNGTSSATYAEGISFEGGGGNIFNRITKERPWCGIWMCGTGQWAHRCNFVDWACNGINIGNKPGIDADLGSNLCFVTNCNFIKLGHAGIYFDGADSSAGGTYNCSFIYCGYFGIHDSSFLANGHYNHHCRAIGTGVSGTRNQNVDQAGRPPVVFHNNWYWYCTWGNESTASITEPGTNPDIWAPWMGPYGSQHPEIGQAIWTYGMTLLAGSSYLLEGLNAPTTFFNCYTENDAIPPWTDVQGIVMGGLLGRQQTSPGAHMRALGGSFFNRGRGQGIGARWATVVGTAVANDHIILLGGGASISQLFFFSENTHWLGGLRIKAINEDRDILLFDFSNAGNSAGLIYTGRDTLQTFGSAAPKPYSCWVPRLYAGSNARRIEFSGIPTSGDWARGDLVINVNAAPSQPAGWICTTAGIGGSTAVFKAMANLAA